MSENSVFVPLCAGSLVAVTVSGCFFFQDEDCFGPDYCDGDKLWTVDGPQEWSSGCVENIEEDCSETGRICQEYDDGYGHQEAGCFYADISCDTGIQAMCDGDFVYQCDLSAKAAVERESCAESGRVCRKYTDETGETAGCFYEGISCETDGGDAVAAQVCDGDVAYVCNTDAAMAFKLQDCREVGRICVEVADWGAVCTTLCTEEEEGERKCNETAIMIIRCEGGAWIPEKACMQNNYCTEIDQVGTAEPLCVQESRDDIHTHPTYPLNIVRARPFQ